MAADQDDFLRSFAATHFGNHIGRLVFRAQPRVDGKTHFDRLATAQHVGEEVGIGVGQRRGGNFRDVLGVAHHAGVRQTVVVGADGAQQIGHRAMSCRHRGAFAACCHGGAVAAAIAGTCHAMADVGDLADERTFRRVFQVLERGKFHHFRLDGMLAGADTAAQCHQMQRLREGRKHFRFFLPASPHRETHRLGANDIKTHAAELLHGPCHRARVGLGAGHARADFGGQGFDDVVSAAAGQCALAQLCGDGEGFIGQVRDRSPGQGRKGQRQRADEKQFFHFQVPKRKAAPQGRRHENKWGVSYRVAA